jgi:spore coat protein U-like protein
MNRTDALSRVSGGPSRIGLLAVALLLATLRAEAASTCSLVSVTGITFGAYDPLEARPVTQVGALTIRCSQAGTTPMLPIMIDLSAGNSGTYNFRHLRKGGDSLRYNLYLDPASTQVWGNGAGGSSHYPHLPSNNAETTLLIYGRILPGQNAAAGTYTDTITVTLSF